MRKNYFLNFTLALVMLIAPSPSWAHIQGIDNSALFLSGLSHPLSGLDHLFILIAIGILSIHLQSRAQYTLTALFLGCLSIGFSLPPIQGALPWSEIIISLSVLTLGALLLFHTKLGTSFLFFSTPLFATSHGYTHGIESINSSPQVLIGILISSGLVILFTTLLFSQNFFQNGIISMRKSIFK